MSIEEFTGWAAAAVFVYMVGYIATEEPGSIYKRLEEKLFN